MGKQVVAAIIGQSVGIEKDIALDYIVAHETRIGARAVNQDRLGHWRTGESVLMVVADGMGGHIRGELAAQLAVRDLGEAFSRAARPALADPVLFLEQAMLAAHAAILQEACRLGMPDSPRTVLVACVVQEGRAYWAHVGDCRLYLVRAGRVVARTRDHTMAQRLIDEGRLTEDAVARHPERNRILQCLGGFNVPRLGCVGTAQLERRDRLLLCSDGLWGALTERELLQGLQRPDLREALGGLATLAEQLAGRQCDNVSALAMVWGSDPG